MITKEKKIKGVKKDINDENKKDNDGVKEEDEIGFNLKDDFRPSDFKISRAKGDEIKRDAIRSDRLKMPVRKRETSEKPSGH